MFWPIRHTGRPAAWLSTLTAVASFVIALLVLRDVAPMGAPPELWTMPWLVHGGRVIAEVGFRVDAVSASMLVVVTCVAACVQVYSLGYMSHEPKPALGRYYAWHSLFIVAMAGLVLAPNLLQLVAGWELVGLCSYLLIGFYWAKPSAGKAAVKAVWVTRFADIGLMCGLVLLYVETGGFAWEGFSWANPGASELVAALLFLGVMGKSAQVPLHVWLPDAMEGPTPVSALLHAATMVAAGVFLVVRCWPLFEGAETLLVAMSWIGAITALVAAITASVQTDIKKVLAYSTCSQLGYMVAGLGSGEMLGGYFHLTTHAFFKALLFLGAGSVIHAVHSNEMGEMGGLRKKIPLTAALFAIGTFALAGFPGLSGFFSKDLLLEEVAHGGQWGPLAILLFVAGLTPFYMMRVYCLVFLGEPSEKSNHAHESPLVMLAPMALLAIPAAVLGFGAGSFGELLGHEYHFAVTPVGAAATVAGLLGLGLGYAKFGMGQLASLELPGLAAFVRSGPIDNAWRLCWERGLLPVARNVGWFDRYVVDGLVNFSGWITLEAGDRIRRLQTGSAHDYLYAAALGAVLIAVAGVVGGVLA
ncbi:NADH dehydrogenase subunit 5 [Deltaproteobacteria bacterium]|nr:NADH dehydrogenase subunit 5 [Deltaproteobacteria bacterium]